MAPVREKRSHMSSGLLECTAVFVHRDHGIKLELFLSTSSRNTGCAAVCMPLSAQLAAGNSPVSQLADVMYAGSLVMLQCVRMVKQGLLRAFGIEIIANWPLAQLWRPFRAMALSFMEAVTTQAKTAPAKRRREQSSGASSKGGVDQQVQELTTQLRNVMKIVSQHDRDLRELEAWSTHTFLLKKETQLAQELMAVMDTWRSQVPEKGPHPLGPPRWTVAGALANWLVKEGTRREQAPTFSAFHDAMTSLPDMESSVQLAVAKETKDHRVLLRIRPQLARQQEWNEAVQVVRAHVETEGGELKLTAAPPGPTVWLLEPKQPKK